MNLINLCIDLFSNLEGFKGSRKTKGATRPPKIWKSKPNITIKENKKNNPRKSTKIVRKCKKHRCDDDYYDDSYYDDDYYDDYYDYDYPIIPPSPPTIVREVVVVSPQQVINSIDPIDSYIQNQSKPPSDRMVQVIDRGYQMKDEDSASIVESYVGSIGNSMGHFILLLLVIIAILLLIMIYIKIEK